MALFRTYSTTSYTTATTATKPAPEPTRTAPAPTAPQRTVTLAPELAPVTTSTAPYPQLAPDAPQTVLEPAPSYSPSLAPAPAPTPTSPPSSAPSLRIVVRGGPCEQYVNTSSSGSTSSGSTSSGTQAAPIVRGGVRDPSVTPIVVTARTTERIVAPLGTLLPSGDVAPPGSILPDGRVVDSGGFLRSGGSATPDLDVIAPFGTLRPDGSVAAVGELLPDGRVVAPAGAILADGTLAPVGFSSARGEQNFGISAQQTQIASRRTILMRRVDGILEPSDEYARGVIQALQVALVSYADSQGIGLQLIVDGRLTPATVATALAVIAEIGPPAGITEMPETDEDIARYARAYAEDIAAVLGIQLDFMPVDTFVLTSEPGPPAALPPSIFSGRNLKIGAALVGGFLLFNR